MTYYRHPFPLEFRVGSYVSGIRGALKLIENQPFTQTDMHCERAHNHSYREDYGDKVSDK